jgi:hypothetical protein
LDAVVDLRDVQIAARHADPRTTMRHYEPARTSTATPITSWPPTWPQVPERPRVSRGPSPGRRPTLPMSGSATSAAWGRDAART